MSRLHRMFPPQILMYGEPPSIPQRRQLIKKIVHNLPNAKFKQKLDEKFRTGN